MRRQNRVYRFLTAFLLGVAPSPALMGAFALGLIVVGILANLLYDLLTAPAEVISHVWVPLAVCLALTLVGYVLYLLEQNRRGSIGIDVGEAGAPDPCAGIIWLLGPGQFDHLLIALDHHLQGDGATHCWLVMQDVSKVRDAFTRLSKQLIDDGVSTQLYPVYIDETDVEATYKAVRNIVDRLIPEAGLRRDQVVADITGGTKQMTAGMMLAALATSSGLEYVASRRDEEGRTIEGTARVVKIDLGFYVERQGKKI